MALTFKQKRQRRLPILRLLALAIVALLLLLGSNAFSASDRYPSMLSPLDKKEQNTGNARTLSKQDMKGDYTARTLCVDGYKFIVANKYFHGSKTSAISLTQFYEERDGKALPAKCK